MKTTIFSFLMTCFVIGMVITAFAESPNNKKGDKTKTENLTPPPLLSNWTLTIDVTDACDTGYCTSIKNCTISLVLNASTSNCVAAYPITGSIPFVMCQSSYSVQIPDTIACVTVSAVVVSSPCYGTFNPTTCCSCKRPPNNVPCKIKICQ